MLEGGEKMSKRTLRVYLGFEFLSSLAINFIMATYVLFLVSKGLNLYQVNLVNFCFMVAVILFELPTGILADLLGRRLAVGLAWVFLGLAGIIYFLSENFWQFILAEIMAAVGLSFQSGSLEAWVKDSLDYYESEHNDQAVFAKGGQVAAIASLIGSLIGGLIGIYNLAVPWLVQGLLSFTAAAFAFVFMTEEYFCAKKVNWKNVAKILKNHISQSYNRGLKNRVYLWLVIVQLGLSLGIQGLNMQWPVYFKDGLGMKSVILVCLGIQVFAWLGAKAGEKMSYKKISHKRQLLVAQLAIAFFVMMASINLGFYLPLAFFWLHEVGRGLQKPVRLSYINQHISADERATLLSLDGMFMKLGAGIGLLASGRLAHSWSINLSWQVSAVAIVLFTLLLLQLPGGKY